MSKKKTSRVLVAGICISTLLSPVAFEASKGYAAPLEENKGGNLEEVKENKFEQRVFQLPGKGSVEEERERLKQKWNLSANEPTGIYAKSNEEITIEIQGKESIKAFIGTRSYDVEGFKEFDLKPGKNVIKAPNGGILYFYNLNDSGEVTAKVEKGGSHFPLFILGKHTKKDWDEMLKKYKDPYAVELKGERSLVTASYDAVKNHMGNTDPVELMKLHDKIIRMENALAGLSEDGIGVSKSPSHYVQFVEKRIPAKGDLMFATHYHTGYIPDAMDKVLNTEQLTKDGWGPWHEVGHLHQQAPWQWTGMGETTVNIYSLAVQTALGNKSRMEVDGRYEKAFVYLNQPDEKKDFDTSDPIVMFWQLHLVYGDQFYPKLHQMYRVLSDTEYSMFETDEVISNREKKQMFIYMASKASGQNLISYFAKWGLHAEADTVEKVNKLQLPEPKNEIWLSRDSNPIREKQAESYKVPYGEAVNSVPDIFIGTKFDEKKASELVQNLGEGVKVTGKIAWPKQENGKQFVNVEIVDTEGNVNAIPVPVNVVYGDSMAFKTYWNTNSVLTLDHKGKKFNTTLVRNILNHSYRDQKYVSVTIYDANGNEKKNVSAEGHEGLKGFVKELDGMSFEYGDILKVYHIQPQYLDWYHDNKLADQGAAKNKKEKFFKITEQGYELIDGLQEVTAVPQKVVVGTDATTLDAKNFVEIKDGEVVGFVETPITTTIGEQKVKVETKDRFGNKQVTEVSLEVIYGDSIAYVGYDNKIASVITLKHGEKKLHATDMNEQIHKYFDKEQYMGITLYDGNGKVKKHVTAEGQETSKNFAEQVNGMQFEYGDVVKVFHAEPDRLKWYQNNNLAGQGEKKGAKELFFKVTEKGFEKMDMLQEVKAKPQQVVVGTDVEKLDPKAFVEVKDGEVVGFVEKPTTSKIGEQKVKVETKDRFGNKQVTEVRLEVIYGDSIMFFGTSYGGTNIKSVVTLKHEEKKFSTTDSEGPMHTSFKDEKYMGMTVYDKDGKEKKTLSVKASENTKGFVEQFNGMAFEYGDVVKIYQREFDRFKVYKKNELVDAKYGVNEVFFKVTEQGFERMEAVQEVTPKPQKVVVGTDTAKLNAKDFVEVKDGEVIGFIEKPNTSKIGEQKVKVETKDRFGNKQVTEVPLEVIYGDSIMFFGTSYGGTNIKSVVTLKHEEKKFSTTDSEGPMHTSFADEKYMGMTVYDKDGKEKKTLSVKASENTKGFAEQFNGMAFEYGDVVKIYQREFDRFKVYKKNELVDAKYGVNEVFFKVTEQGFERMEALQEVTAKPQKVVVGTEVEKLEAKNFVEVKDGEVIGFVEKPNTSKIGERTVKVETKDRFGNKQVTEVPLEVIYGDSIMFFGTGYNGSNIKSVVTLNHEEKKLNTIGTEGPTHSHFINEKYMGLTVYDQEGKEKKQMILEGTENTKAFAEQFNGMSYEYGDVVKVYQAEFDRFKVYKKNELIDTKYGVNEVFFKITEQGFERIGALQEVKAKPQKVVIGTNSETLDAKNFVEVKDGEVIGFVEKLDTSKIGKQTVKVETKDRFGNKQVTEVPVEVTYGDSIVYQGLSNSVRSIVTFNHEEKKLHVTHTNEQIHSYFKNELYMGITLYDGERKEKKHVTAEGQETSKNFAEQVNGTPFEYGDVIKVYHAEPSRLKWYKKSKLEEQLALTEVSFKVTQSGLEQVKGTL
ncbi:M60 family metallopeptidase [Bacillus cereus]|uniref:putative mucin/carbohydrate-binding domain-containing protein n=1 Tax=Bacillus cereus TaxID=1396 RepID=UPI001BB34B6E|nr:putative mucin/carbohydrate-binding domain-containing protein [Bacillus cereus]QUW26247.1 M60 family metallopeptidase [Bacillus cereus]